jgi:ABC-type branched-subunit amino acid transport system substrate-binding protein
MRSKRWDPASNDLKGLLFEGAPALLAQLDNLILRPRRWWRETLLPIIYLVCEPTAGNPLDGLADRLRQTPGVLHSRINGRETPPAENGQQSQNSIRRLLDGMVADLSQRSGRGRPLRFPHYSLAIWLASLLGNHTTSHQPDQPERRVDNALQEFIKERYRLQNRTTSAEVSVINEIPWWVRIPILLLPPLGIRLMRIFWRPPHWVARNRISSEHSSGSFRRLARKFMEQGSGEHQHDIRQDEVDHLLVDSFMEDLRRGYRHTALPGIGHRRTTYPVLLIDRIRSTADSLRLLELISDSRTDYLRKNTTSPGQQPWERAYFHPLLIIVQGDSSALGEIGPSNYRSDDQDSYSIADIQYYYNEWYRSLANSDRTWFIPLKVPIERPPPGLRAKLAETRLPAAPQPVMAFIAVALFSTVISITTYSTHYRHCGAWPWESQLQRESLPADRFQCVGLSLGDYEFFDNLGDVKGADQKLTDELKDVEAKIYKNNELVVKDPKYLTIVYLDQLSSSNVADYRSELEELRGIAVAQQEIMGDRPVRVLLANGGYQMNYATTAAEAIAREASKDPTLVAVVGLGISRKGTREAMIRLARADTHIPMIGTVITATELATKTTPYYHQVGPTNQREADVAAFYAANALRARKVIIYYSDDKDDLYNKDLREQIRPAFEARGLAVSEQQYQIDPGDDDTNHAGRDACSVSPEGVVFYAGRAEQFVGFLEGMRTACEGHYPQVLDGDSITRFVLDGGLDYFPGLTVDYISEASSLAWGSDCNGAVNSVGFFVGYRKIFGNDACTNLRDGTSILAHDTLLAFAQGVSNTGVDRPSPDAVLAGIANISSDGSGALQGASGEIDYPRTSNKAVPKNKAILVLRGSAVMTPKRMLLCGQLDTAQPPPDDNCPKQARP